MELQQFIDNHCEDGEVYSEVEGIAFKQVHYDEYAEHKTVTFTEVHNLVGTEEYFEITTDRDNVGYWGDASSYPPVFRKVKPITRVVEVTDWWPV